MKKLNFFRKSNIYNWIAKLHQNKSEKSLKNQAFTLVELIVVITILAILGTIAFISLQGYTRDARDSVRVSDLKNMETSLVLFSTEVGIFPEPDEKETMGSVSGAIDGKFGEGVYKQLKGLDKLPKDPQTGELYLYGVSKSKKGYRLEAKLEGGETRLLTSHYYPRSCKDVLNFGYSNGDGKYKLYINEEELEVYCDMTNDGGAWALLIARAKYGFPNSGRLEIGENSILKNLNIKEVRWNYISPGQKEFPLIYKFFNKQESDLLLFHENYPTRGPLRDEWELRSIHYPTSAEFANAFSVGEKNTSGIDENSFKNAIKDDGFVYIRGRYSPIYELIYRGTAWFRNYKVKNNYLYFPGTPYEGTWRLGSETFQSSFYRTDGRSISIWIR